MMPTDEIEPRVLVMDEQVSKALVTLRILEEDPMPPAALHARDVEAVEKELGCILPDDILGAFAANSDDLLENAELDLSQIVQLTQDAQGRGCAKDRIAIGRQPDGQAFYCIERRTTWTDQPVKLYEFDNLDQSESGQPFASWLMDRVEQCRGFLSEGDEEEQKRAELDPSKKQLGSFRPIVLPLAAPKAGLVSSGPRTVWHKKFGTGVVLGQTGVGTDRKLEIEFSQVGKKVVLARFVEESE